MPRYSHLLGMTGAPVAVLRLPTLLCVERPDNGEDANGLRHCAAGGGGFLDGREARRGTRLHSRVVLRHADAQRRLFVAMAAAAVNTRRIRLGTGVLVPSNRIAPVAANALASLNKLAPGRLDFGLQIGFT